MVQNVHVVERSINTNVFGYCCVIMEQITSIVIMSMTSVIHEVGWHHNLPTHHMGKRDHGPAGIPLEKLPDNPGIPSLMSTLILSNLTTHTGHVLITVLESELGGIAMGDHRGFFLKTSIYKTKVRIGIDSGIHSSCYQSLYGPFYVQ